MNQQRPEGFWTNMLVQRPVMGSNRTQTEDLTRMDLPAPHSPLSESLLEGRKTGAALLFSGVLLALLGVTFTATGWQYYKSKPDFEWIQLLGPVLISVGGTFVLTSICRFPVLSCRRNRDEDASVRPVMDPCERNPTGLSLSLVSNPVFVHGSSAVLCLPPSYNFVTQEVQQRGQVQPAGSEHTGSPPCDAVFSEGNTVFTAVEEEGGDSAHSTGTDGWRFQRIGTDRGGGGRGGDSSSTSLRPPAYEDIFPSSYKHNQT
ncbi:transmembrane protein 174 [Halichoeres trimaculatus]|uniref:transmembrane protein 174 n=1 Tax=Halichoeres trimaculatus TaxID=147232 RepID=UPI003D9F472E